MPTILHHACTECGHWLFTDPGSTFDKTRVCYLCRDFGGRQKKAPKCEKPIPMNPNPFGVTTGQIWVSLDPRDNGREITVLDVDPDEGRATVLSHGKGGEKRRYIKLTGFTRLKGRGYELRHDSSDGRAVAS